MKMKNKGAPRFEPLTLGLQTKGLAIEPNMLS